MINECGCGSPEYRVSAVTYDPMRRTAVCVKCWEFVGMDWEEAQGHRIWTERDYWDNLDAIEGDRAEEIRRNHGRAA